MMEGLARSQRETAVSRVHVLLDHHANREKLLEKLASEYDLEDRGESLTASDLILCDLECIEAHRSELQEAKEEEHPIFLPVILLSSRKAVRYQYPELQELVDDVLVPPVSSTQLNGRINHLLRLRHQTQTLEAEKEQRRLKERHYRQLFERATDAIILTRPAGEIMDVNPAAADLLARSRADLIGEPISSFFAFEEQWVELRHALEEFGEVHHMEVIQVQPDGEERTTSVSGVVQEDRQAGRFYELISQDITTQKEREQELIRAKEAAEEADRLKTSLLANMGHEIRTPLTSIIGFADLLVEQAPEELTEIIRPIQSSAQRLLTILENILDLSRIQGGVVDVEPEELDIREVVRATVGNLKPRASDEEVTLQFQLPEDPVMIRTDRSAVQRILTNLVHNGIKFTEEGTVTVTLRPQATKCEILVADTGIGMQQTDVDRLYEAFAQGSTGLTRSYEGAGLGLTVARELVRLIGGQIDIESEKGKGTTVTVSLPRETSQTPIRHSNSDTGMGERTVLALDDDPAVGKLLQGMVPQNWSVDFVQTPEEVIEQAQEQTCDVILLDIHLKSEVSGVDVMKKIREIECCDEIPIAALTAYALPSDESKYLEEGFDGYIAKPFTRDIIRKKLAGLVGGTQP